MEKAGTSASSSCTTGDGPWLVVTGGEGPRTRPPFRYSRIVACDSGYDTACSLGIDVDDVVGDLDSSSLRERLIARGVVPCPHDKDETDTELGLMRLPAGCAYDLAGGGGGRVDHLVSILQLFRRYGMPRFWFTGSDVLVSIDGMRRFHLPLDTSISFFALDREAVVECPDMVWPLDRFVLDDEHISLSNRNTREDFVVRTSARVFARIDAGCFENGLTDIII